MTVLLSDVKLYFHNVCLVWYKFLVLCFGMVYLCKLCYRFISNLSKHLTQQTGVPGMSSLQWAFGSVFITKIAPGASPIKSQ